MPNKNKRKYWAVVPAAGIGSRMNAKIPKQYLPLHNATVMDITLRQLLDHPEINGIVLAISEQDRWWIDSQYANHPKISLAIGGQERSDSVLSALSELKKIACVSDAVLVHDAARPCVRLEDITRLIDEVGLSTDGGLLGVKVKDTMKQTDGHSKVIHTPDRSMMWHAFTPQLFPINTLFEALTNAVLKGEVVTDDASAMELAGYQPKMVEGHQDNIKITCYEDLALADFYLAQQIGI